MLNRGKLKPLLGLWLAVALADCGNSTDRFVLGAPAPASGGLPGANQVLLSVSVPANVSGARVRTSTGLSPSTTTAPTASPPTTTAASSTVYISARADHGQTAADNTLPGALCRAYDMLGQPQATMLVSADGVASFTTLRPGVYRFVVTNQDAAVVVEVIASASPDGPTLAAANSSSTAATLLTLAGGSGQFALEPFFQAQAADLAELTATIEAQLAVPGDPWVTSDGRTVTDPAVKRALESALQTVPR